MLPLKGGWVCKANDERQAAGGQGTIPVQGYQTAARAPCGVVHSIFFNSASISSRWLVKITDVSSCTRFVPIQVS